MFFAYFDESGTPGPDGKLVRMTVGGAVAHVNAWKALDEDWAASLHSVGRRGLHMRELMLVPDRERLVEMFASIIAKHTPEIISYTSTIIDSTEMMYEASLVDALMAVANQSAKVGKIDAMIAKHPEFRRQGKLWDFLNWGDARLGAITLGDPKDVFPLQAADLIAHQLRHGGKALRDAGCKIYQWVNGEIVK
jgi:hypothetical protein